MISAFLFLVVFAAVIGFASVGTTVVTAWHLLSRSPGMTRSMLFWLERQLPAEPSKLPVVHGRL